MNIEDLMSEVDGHGGATVVVGKFPGNNRGRRPDWVNAALTRHAGLSYRREVNGNCWIDGVDVTLPNGKMVKGNQGYLRLTGQWREEVGCGYDVEVFCCKTLKSDWVSSRLLIGVRMLDHLE